MSGPRAILFDLGNVLVRLRFERGLARLAALSGACSPLSLRELFRSPLKLAFDRGELDERTFLARLADAIGAPGVDQAALAAAWVDIFDRWPEAEALVEDALAAGHPVYLLSNTDALHMAALRRAIPVLGRVHGAHLSYEARVMKPERAYFEGALARWAIDPAHAVFVDDLAENVEAARAVGLAAVHHTGDVGAVRREVLAEPGAPRTWPS